VGGPPPPRDRILEEFEASAGAELLRGRIHRSNDLSERTRFQTSEVLIWRFRAHETPESS
jgi:hypothetical protein